MGIGLSGITSGLDTDSIIQAMVMDKTTKKDNLVKAQKKLEWKQEAWKTLNTKIYDFYTKTLSDMRLAGSYNKSKTSVSDPTVATVIAKNGSVNGTQALGIEKLAKSGYLTGGKVSTASGEKATNSTKLSDLTNGSSTVGSGSINVTVAGKESVISLNGDMTIKELVSQLKQAGVNASFDSENQRFFISAPDSGKDNDFSITAAGGNGIANLKALGLYTGATESDLSQYKAWAGYDQTKIDGLIVSTFKNRMTTADAEKTALNKEIESLTSSNKSLKESNEKLTEEKKLLEYQRDYANRYLSNTSSTYYNDVKTSLDAYQERVDKGEKLSDEEQERYDDLKVQMQAIEIVDQAIGDETAVTADDRQTYIDNLTKSINAKTDEITKNETTIAENTAKITEKSEIVGDEQKLAAYVQEKNYGTGGTEQSPTGGIYQSVENEINAKWESAKNYMIQYNYNNGTDEYKAAHQTEYEASVGAIGDISYTQSTDGSGAVRIDGENAVIYLNGAKFESTSNSMTINGLTITAQELTGVDENGKLKTVSVTTSQDSEGIYNMVKNFLKGYNELINEMDSLYNADSAKGYEPLTDDEKEEMSDKEIELWEEKIKDSLLRRDSSLNNIIQVLKTSMAGGTTIDGKRYYLSEFGIQTGGYLNASQNERGAYHIDGDEEDSLFASNTDKLMAAIVKDPDHVTEVLSGIATNLYDNMTKAMRTTTLSSTYTVYNDKQMKEEYNSYTEKIAAQEEKITWWEDYYRSKFTTMETMLASLNQQQSSLSGLLS